MSALRRWAACPLTASSPSRQRLLKLTTEWIMLHGELTNLMLTLMVKYDNLRDSVAALQHWYIESAASSVNAGERFKEEWGGRQSIVRG